MSKTSVASAARGWAVRGLLAAILVAGTVGSAGAVSERVKNACANDYYRFCPNYEIGSTKLRNCMRTQGKRLSKACIDALVDSGELPRRSVRK